MVITHAGMNTVLTALSCGVPLVAIPITNEQPGIAARLQRTKAGKMIRLRELDESTLRNAVTEILTQASYRENAHRLQQSMQAAGGVVRATDIIERVAQTRKPVIASTPPRA
ncbi:MAG: glycosyltransferase (plasmid) [Leptolyngbya sp. BL-A-14]